MKKFFSFLMGGLAFLGITSCTSTSSMSINTSTVQELDINRFMGLWYEVARYNHSFERGLEGCTALYSLNEDGTIRIANSGYKGGLDGKFRQSIGKARRTNDKMPGQLEVSFFWNFYSPYNVLELAPDYRYALVGSDTEDFLWILSRTPKMSDDDLAHVLKCANERGYDVTKLIWVQH